MTSATDQGSSPFATALRDARVARSLSVADIAKSLLLSDNQVAGLEADDFSSFYGASYVERAARRYAEFLGVDAGLEGAPRSTVQSSAPVELVPTPSPLASPIEVEGKGLAASPILRWALAAGLAIAAITVGTKLVRDRAQPTAPVAQITPTAPVAEAPPVETPAPAPEAEPVVSDVIPAAPAPVSAEPPKVIAAPESSVPDDRDHRFFLVVNRDVTVQAKDVYGTVLLNGRQRPDVGRRVVGEPPFDVQVSDDEAVEIYYRGQRIRPGANVYDGITASVVR